MTGKKIRNILAVITLVFAFFYVAVFAHVFADRNYPQGSPWPDIFTVSAIVVGALILGAWVWAWNKK